MKKPPQLTFDRLIETLVYTPSDGIFTCRCDRVSAHGRVMCAAGDVVGTTTSQGRLVIRIDGKDYVASRLAWFYMTGKWPEDQIDHKNLVRTDNRWENLRDVTDSINKQNKRKASTRSKTGFLGVLVDRRRFSARIRVNGKNIHLGCFKTAPEAHAAYVQAKRNLHPGNTL